MGTTEGESVMGYIEVYNIDKDGEWTDLDDIPMITVINCQLCNEPTEAHDIIIPAVIKDGVLTAGTWQNHLNQSFVLYQQQFLVFRLLLLRRMKM